MKPQILFVQRQSPPWSDLARDCRAGLYIDPMAYMPSNDIAGFPAEVPRLIELWNSLFAIDYFTCRAVMQEIAETNNRAAPGAMHIGYKEYERFRSVSEQCLVYFHDDDDIFDPNIADLVGEIETGQFDVLVSPLFRFQADLFTFVREGAPCDLILGRPQNFHFRYQTNNYGIVGTSLDRAAFAGMKDHVEASAYSDVSGFSDHVVSRPLSATIKTIWSASMLPLLDEGRGVATDQLRGFRERVAELQLPADYTWLSRSLDQFCTLMSCAEEGQDFSYLTSALFNS